ncbi:Uncharacterised protein [Mycobacterium tuberculosis]|uniref:Uncharacterized protein n=1 Tax=Mycobacterium tuberculosis TaxID=1773 RepID=A0A0U0S958_MYCTX|nr:Uncharacterised protein [Mycobacterium tuberculosis]
MTLVVAPPSPPKARSMLSLKPPTDSVDVSMIRSAVARTGASILRSAAMPSARVCSPCSG